MVLFRQVNHYENRVNPCEGKGLVERLDHPANLIDISLGSIHQDCITSLVRGNGDEVAKFMSAISRSTVGGRPILASSWAELFFCFRNQIDHLTQDPHTEKAKSVIKCKLA